MTTSTAPRQRRTRPAPLRLRLPATSANLGSGFDAAACALDLALEIRASAATAFSVHASGRDRAICGDNENNLVLTTYREVLASAEAQVWPLALRVGNEIPIGKGCGSSAAARLAGILLAVHFGRLGWSEDRILAVAAAREGHADNAAACWHGGFICLATAAGNGTDEPGVERIAASQPAWPLILAVPAQALPTEEARAILPAKYSRADAVANVQASMLLAAAFLLGRRELLAAAMRDRLHEPYRSRLCPLLTALKPLAGSKEIAGVCLSGAGPSVLLMLAPGASLAVGRRRIQQQLRDAGLQAELIATHISKRGARQSWRQR